MSTTSELRPLPELRRRMIADLQLRGMSERTQEMYVRAVRQLAEHFHKSPDQITEEELREYFLHVKNVKKWSRASMTIALCGIKFFYEHTIKLPWTILTFVRPPQEKKLPTILTREEVRLILSNVRLLRYRVCLQTIYSCGLRLNEGTHLQVADIDAQRQLIHLYHAKGGASKLALETFPVFGPQVFGFSSCHILAREDFTRAKNRETNLGNFGPFWTPHILARSVLGFLDRVYHQGLSCFLFEIFLGHL